MDGESLAIMGTAQPLSPTLDATAQGAAMAERQKATSGTITAAAAKGDDVALVSALSDLVRAPTFLTNAFRSMTDTRKYVSELCMLRDTQDTVAVNMVLRNQIIALAYLGVFNPQPFVQPQRQVGNSVSDYDEKFAQTAELHISRCTAQMDFATILEGGCQDASTNGYAIFKVTLQDDFMKDPIGGNRFGDMQEQVAEYLRLKALKDSGELQEGTADYELWEAADATIRTFMAGKLADEIAATPVLVPQQIPITDQLGQPLIDPATGQPVTQEALVPDPRDPREMERIGIINGEPVDILGLPEIEHYRGFQCMQVLPDDWRWDWTITRPEDLHKGEWQAQRLYMTPDAITRKWGKDALGSNGSTMTTRQFGSLMNGNSTTRDPSDRYDVEATMVDGRHAVWEVWHKPTWHRYVFLEGSGTMLEKEVVQATGTRFFPFFYLGFNRVTGAVQAISDVELARGLQDEVNMLRTHDREARRAGYPILFIPKGLMSAGDKSKYRSRDPFSVIEVDRPEELQKYLQESTTVPYNPGLYNTGAAESQLQQVFGLPLTVTGAASNEDLASALALAKEGMETGVARRRIQVNRAITDIFMYMLEISLRVFGEPFMKEQYGAEAVWPQFTAEQIATHLRVEVKGGLTGQPRSAERLEFMQQFATIAQTLGMPVNPIPVMRDLVDAMGLRVDFTKYLPPAFLMAIMQQMGMGVPPQGTPAPAPKGESGGEGAPPMTDPQRGAPSSLAQVPNNALGRVGL